MEKFYEERRAAIMSAPAKVSPKVHAAFMEKLKELEQVAVYSRTPVAKIQKELNERKEMLEEKERFLVEEKIGDLLTRHPEWAREIESNLYNLKWSNPIKGTPLAEE
jgi:hypothetical protein